MNKQLRVFVDFVETQGLVELHLGGYDARVAWGEKTKRCFPVKNPFLFFSPHAVSTTTRNNP
jgi:hypothetical protein